MPPATARAFRSPPGEMTAHVRALGPGVRAAMDDRGVTADDLGEVAVDRGVALLRPGGDDADLAVLHQPGGTPWALLDEIDRLLWLAGAAPAPDLIATGRADDGSEAAAIRLGSVADTAEHGHPMGPEALVQTLATSLLALHDRPTDHCPFVADTAALRAVVDRRVEAAEIAEAADGPYAGRSATELAAIFDDLIDELGESHEPVFVHAALRPDRIWLDPDGTATFLGWQWSGLGDRHVDLAAVATLLTRLHGPALVAPFVEAYGFDRVDIRRLDAHQLLAHLLS